MPSVGMETPPPLCMRCREMEQWIAAEIESMQVDGIPTRDFQKTFAGSHSFSTIEQGAVNGCPLCRLLRFSVYTAFAPGWEQARQFSSTEELKRGSFPKDVQKVNLQPRRTRAGDSCGSVLGSLLVYFRVAGTELSGVPLRMCADKHAAVEPFARTSVSDLRLVSSMARAWLSDCVNTHTSCRIDDRKHWSPRRLVYTRPTECKLVETKSGQAYRYCALSYCWGRDQFGLTKSNVAQLYEQMWPPALSKTVSDAIEVAAALGLDYIWIDALCIIQDDAEDWSREAQSMQLVYENAQVTLAVSGFQDSRSGLFGFREPSRYPMAPVNLAGSALHPQRPNIQSMLGRPWRRRAWTLQEEAVSRRVLYWDYDKLLWDCRECERYEWGYAEDAKWQSEHCPITKWSSQPPSILTESQRLPGMEHIPRVHRAWQDTVEDYWARAITYPKDWPIAIQGLANIAQKLQPDDQLVWGIWKSRMPGDLLWSLQNIDSAPNDAQWSTFAPPERHQGPPSWSWFSRLGQGRLSRQTLWECWPVEKASFLAACVDVESEDKSLFPRAAVVHLRGWLVAEWMQFTSSQRRISDRFRETKFLPVLDIHENRKDYHEIRGLLLRSSLTFIDETATTAGGRRAWEHVKTEAIRMDAKQYSELAALPQEDIVLV